MKHEAQFRFRYHHADTLHHAIWPETQGELHPRSRATCSLKSRDELELTVYAADLSALRASLNMWLRLVNVAKEMLELARKEGDC